MMRQFHFHAMPCRFLTALLLPLLLITASCRREGASIPASEPGPVAAELDEMKKKLGTAEKSLLTKGDELALTSNALEAANKGLAELKDLLAARDSEIRTVRTELDALKKRDAFVFADISAIQQEGQSAVALSRYEKFVRDFPTSPLSAHALRVISELRTGSGESVKRAPEIFDPQRPERNLVKRFSEGLSTPQELAPLFKGKTRAQVVAFAGRPNRVFNDGTEFGYEDKAINDATGKKGMLIVSFQSEVVSSLRLEYAGRKIVP
jgi:hypothetical protein